MTSEALERAIDEVGRDRVFMRARSYGWKEGCAPEFVWWGIVQELRDKKPSPANQRGIFDFLWGG